MRISYSSCPRGSTRATSLLWKLNRSWPCCMATSTRTPVTGSLHIAFHQKNLFNIFSFRLSRPALERKAQLCGEALSSLSRLEAGLSEWKIVLLTELALTQDPAYLHHNPDPDGRRGMMAKFLLQDGMLSLTNCLQLCDK